MHKLRVSEYARLTSDNEKSVYRKIHRGELQAEKINGILHVVCDRLPSDQVGEQSDNRLFIEEKDARIQQLETENEYLRQQLDQTTRTIQQMQEDSESDRQRSDTIILQLTQKFEEQTNLLEDMRHQSLWSKVKTVLGFAAS
ncbi:MAG: hypothetical protein ACYS6K_28430 [Planctomycetota bacterium]|jgi:hypothetical protein